MEKMLKSKTFLIIASVLVLTALALIVNNFILNPKLKTYKEINYEQLKELMDSDERFILFIGSKTCSHCIIFQGTVNSVVSKYNIVINYIDVSQLKETEYAYLNSRLSFSGTPTTVLVDKGTLSVEKRVLTKVKGSKSIEEFTKVLKNYNFIKE